MLTLLPFSSFSKCAESFFDETLINQLQEVDDILNVLHRVDRDESSWDYSPSVLMWLGYEPQLCAYGLAICDEILLRKDLIFTIIMECYENHINWHLQCATSNDLSLSSPAWFGLEKFHQSHQSELIRRDCRYSLEFGVGDDIPLYWPVIKT